MGQLALAGLHPTLYAICAPLAALLAVRRARRDAVASGSIVALVARPLVTWWALGNLTSGLALGTVGFGFFSTNILSLVDPYDGFRSAFLPTLPHGLGQYEGSAYLGAGVILLVMRA